jgi:hypothetical protein
MAYECSGRNGKALRKRKYESKEIRDRGGYIKVRKWQTRRAGE